MDEMLAVVAKRAAEILDMGGVVLFPTDTLYGLGADAFSDDAVDKVYAIKGRNEGKPIHALVKDVDMAAQFADISVEVRELIQKLPKGKVTFICKKKSGFDTGVGRGIETFGFRIPDNAFCMAMLDAFDAPITATSANLSGARAHNTLEEIREQLGDSAHGIALAIDGGALETSEASTVVDMTASPPRILRVGAVSEAEFTRILSL